MLVQHVFDDRIHADPALNLVRAADVHFLIAGDQVVIGQEQRVAEEAIGQKGAVIRAADEIARHRHLSTRAHKGRMEASGVRRTPKRTTTDQRRKGPDCHPGIRRVDGRLERTAGEGLGHDGIEIRVRTAEDHV